MLIMFPVELETRRLRLRRPRMSDAESVFRKYAQDAEVTRYLQWRPHSSVDTTRSFIANCEAQWRSASAFPYVIASKEDGELLGMIELRPRGHRVEFGFVLARAYWGNGLMPEAVSALTAVALGQPDVYRVEATCDAENRASARVLEKSGFEREGQLRRYIVHPNVSPEPRDSYLYAIAK
jgi:RimJ/RimL family protein N-acetyltransferase